MTGIRKGREINFSSHPPGPSTGKYRKKGREIKKVRKLKEEEKNDCIKEMKGREWQGKERDGTKRETKLNEKER